MVVETVVVAWVAVRVVWMAAGAEVEAADVKAMAVTAVTAVEEAMGEMTERYIAMEEVAIEAEPLVQEIVVGIPVTRAAEAATMVVATAIARLTMVEGAKVAVVAAATVAVVGMAPEEEVVLATVAAMAATAAAVEVAIVLVAERGAQGVGELGELAAALRFASIPSVAEAPEKRQTWGESA